MLDPTSEVDPRSILSTPTKITTSTKEKCSIENSRPIAPTRLNCKPPISPTRIPIKPPYLKKTHCRIQTDPDASSISEPLPVSVLSNQEVVGLNQEILKLIAIHGDTHLELTKLQNKIGSLLFSLGEYQEASKFYHEALSIVTTLKQHRFTATVTSQEWLQEMQDLRMGLGKSLSKYRLLEAVIYTNLGTTQWRLTHFQPALHSFIRAYKHHKFTTNLREKSDAAHNLGSAYIFVRDRESALHVLQEALTLRIRLFGKNNLEVARTLSVIATTLAHRGHYLLALEWHTQVLNIKQGLYSQQEDQSLHHSIVLSLKDIARIYDLVDRPNDTLELYQEVLAMERPRWRDMIGEDFCVDKSLEQGMLLHALGNLHK